MVVSRRMFAMPRAHPPEFRQRASSLLGCGRNQPARSRTISETRIVSAELDPPGRYRGRPRAGVTKDEHAELIERRRELRVAKMEVEILKRAAARRSMRFAFATIPISCMTT